MFLTQIKNMTWQTECDMSIPYRAMTVQIGFSHKENNSDETEFCINAWDAKELDELFKIFCQENNFADVSINNLSIVRVAATLEELTELEEQEASSSMTYDDKVGQVVDFGMTDVGDFHVLIEEANGSKIKGLILAFCSCYPDATVPNSSVPQIEREEFDLSDTDIAEIV